MWIFLDWLGDRVDGWQLACRSIRFLKICKWHPFGSWCHDNRDHGEHRLILCFFGSPKISGCEPIFWDWELQIRDDLAPPFINKLDLSGGSSLSFEKSLSLNSSSVLLLSRHASFSPLHQMEKGKVERIVVKLPLFWSLFGMICQPLWWVCHDTLAIVTTLRHRGQ